MGKNVIQVTLDVRKQRRFLDDIHNNAVLRATAPAVNRTIKKVNTQVVKQLSKASGMPQREIRKLLPLDLARVGEKSAAITTRRNHRTPNLIHFGAKKRQRHLSARAFGRTLQYRKGFIGNQNRTAFKRTGKSSLPIEPLHGPNPVRAFGSDKHHSKFVKLARSILPIEYAGALAFHTARIRRR